MSKNLKWPTGVIAESMGLAAVLNGRERGSERGGAQGQGPLLGNIVYWGQEEPEPFKEEVKEWSFTLLPDMRFHPFRLISQGFRQLHIWRC